jgi:hypothetical protein
VVVGFSDDGVQKVDSTEGTCHQRVELLALNANLTVPATVREDIMIAKLAQGEFTVIAVSAEVLHTMESLA